MCRCVDNIKIKKEQGGRIRAEFLCFRPSGELIRVDIRQRILGQPTTYLLPKKGSALYILVGRLNCC
jgi:hypothetical protein